MKIADASPVTITLGLVLVFGGAFFGAGGYKSDVQAAIASGEVKDIAQDLVIASHKAEFDAYLQSVETRRADYNTLQRQTGERLSAVEKGQNRMEKQIDEVLLELQRAKLR